MKDWRGHQRAQVVCTEDNISASKEVPAIPPTRLVIRKFWQDCARDLKIVEIDEISALTSRDYLDLSARINVRPIQRKAFSSLQQQRIIKVRERLTNLDLVRR